MRGPYFRSPLAPCSRDNHTVWRGSQHVAATARAERHSRRPALIDSQMLVTDELKSATKMTTLTFVEFLEAIARASASLFKSTPAEQKGERRRTWPLSPECCCSLRGRAGKRKGGGERALGDPLSSAESSHTAQGYTHLGDEQRLSLCVVRSSSPLPSPSSPLVTPCTPCGLPG